ncbi:MAG: LURP-one-related family protein [Lachnospiraceae bacterium]|nr:LURP-one-related family protein [Lachnospiraceae bacterium]MBQ8549050.1 LURP-one-related family protein [Lachnospiraceae bacterium]MBQ8845555.1 LURP-one-related family protein [Lachnospiraceae bacterium]
MKLYIKQKIFSWNDKFSVFDANGEERYFVEGEFFSWGKKLHVYDSAQREAAFIRQEVLTFLPKFIVSVDGQEIAEIVKEFTFFKPKYRIDGLGWAIDGDFWDHDYEITKNGSTIVSISKEWFTWGDCYELDIESPEDEITALAVVLAIDCVLEAQRNN